MGSSESRSERRNAYAILCASAAAYGFGNISWWLQPMIVQSAMARYGVGEASAGLVVALEMAMIAISSMMTARFVQRTSLRALASGGALIALIGTVFSLIAPDYQLLLAARALTGTGEGIPLAVASAALAHLPDPDRAYGKINVANVALGTVSMLVMPMVGLLIASEFTVFGYVLGLLALLSLFLVALPDRGTGRLTEEAPRHRAPHSALSVTTLRLLVGVFLVSLMSATLWPFYFVLGPRVGLTEDQVSVTLGIAIAGSMLGSLGWTIIGARFGRLVPMTAAVLIMTVANLSLSLLPDPNIFRAAAIVNLAALSFLVPCFLGYAAAQDPSGRDSALMSGSFLLTGAVGPFVGGLVLERLGPTSIGWIILVSNTIAWCILVGVDRHQTPARAAVPG